MIALGMLHALTVALLAGAGAAAAERALRLLHLPGRWAWVAALGVSVLVPLLAHVPLGSGGAGEVPGEPGGPGLRPVLARPALVAAPDSPWARADRPLLLLWLVASTAALLFLVVAPWDLPLRWQWRRLRLAVEADCDARVLRGLEWRSRAYGDVLLDIARRRGPSLSAAVALGEPRTMLERRIRMFTATPPPRRRLRALAWSGTPRLAAVGACLAPEPRREAAPGSVEISSPAVPEGTGDVARRPTFTPYTLRPDLVNRREVKEALAREYPPELREAGIGGTVIVWFFLGEDGAVRAVRKVQLARGSGRPALDEAALRVAPAYRFTPARHGARPVAVWVPLPVTFRP